MKLKQLLNELVQGEFFNLALREPNSNTIKPERLPAIINYINEGLMVLHTKFILKEKVIILETVDSINEYLLHSKYSVSSGYKEDYWYIKDTPDNPFKDDIVKVLEVRDIYGNLMSLNDPEVYNSMFTPQPLVLQIPFVGFKDVYTISYQANHPIIDIMKENYLDNEIELPPYLILALKNYVSYKVFSHMGGPENGAKAQEHYLMFEQANGEVIERDLINTTYHTSHNKLEKRGFI